MALRKKVKVSKDWTDEEREEVGALIKEAIAQEEQEMTLMKKANPDLEQEFFKHTRNLIMIYRRLLLNLLALDSHSLEVHREEYRHFIE
jgi:hypothetical protein